MNFTLPLAPVRASTFADGYDLLFYIITLVSLFFFVVVFGAVLFFAIRYRRGSKVNRSHPPHDNLPLEITWSVIPLLMGLVVFAWGAKQFIWFTTPPKNGLEVYCVGKQWMWHFQHAGSGIRENNELHVPVGVPVTVTMTSQDVIHALFIPEFRFQYQVVPGRYTQAWFQATQPGVYHLFCNMYCGAQHSEMGGYVYAMTPKDYAEWKANGGNDPQPMTLAQRGHLVFDRNSCANCHAQQDNERAPTLNGVFGKVESYTDGSTYKVDAERLREAILNPYKHIVLGYGNTMPAYQGAISEEDIIPLVAYLQTLGVPLKGSTSQEVNQVDDGAGTSFTTKSPPRMATGVLESRKQQFPAPSGHNLAVNALAAQNRESSSQYQNQPHN